MVIAGVMLAGAQETVYKPGNGVTLPVVVKQVKANYTQAAKDARVVGTVLLEAVVRADGTVGDVNVSRSLDGKYGLDEEAVKAMKQWRFKPGMKDDVPVAVRIEVEMAFTLR
jgi:TonB family protein